MDQVFQPVRRHVKRDDIAGLFLARRLLQTLGLQHAVDFALDFVELGLPAADPDAPADNPRTTNAWFNTQLFAGGCNNATYTVAPYVCVPLGTFGNAGRDVLHAPGTIQWDMSASRIFQFHESIKLQYKAEFFNIMNHANWNSPTATLSSATFGQVTAFGSPRLIQMSLKFLF